MAEENKSYGMSVVVDLDYDEAVEKTVAALKAQGFGVLTEIDVKATMKQKLDADFRRYVILGACNPPLAFKALSTEREIGLLLPCNVIVYENDAGGSTVATLNPMVAMTVADNPALTEVAQSATSKLRAALDWVSAIA